MLRRELPGRRPRGRPKRGFMDGVKESIKVVGLREKAEDNKERRQYFKVFLRSYTFLTRVMKIHCGGPEEAHVAPEQQVADPCSSTFVHLETEILPHPPL
ncbi:hypothetical protein ATANTOWER_015053 [Ataeniobius toweri]|uniref:Uncharacterized protein n=1 Tax=Ataeniobius toweri TaxID=208326 RepID=A0ABU7BGB1_9TELE|nr:hypothetical protein [Ataeniobius toweri]